MRISDWSSDVCSSDLNAEQRAQELRLVRSEIAQLTADVARFGKAQADLTIAAPRSGILMHRSSWNGDKFDVGSQVWRGQTIAEIPDPATLAVRAELPERDYLRVRAGMRSEGHTSELQSLMRISYAVFC